ncbi:MAG: tetratricopeptide repeat protein [Candidatus Dadabacteria bacterium]|nr:tetratricopeptide repeat protein [Candidatus Dadabacteria bacterium]
MPGDNYSTEDDLVKFEEKYARILTQDPSSVAFIFLAQVLYKQGKVDKAINVLINGLKYNKKSVTGRFLLGKIYYDRWLIEQAKREFRTVVELAPDNLAACKMLVQILKSEEAYDKALELLRTASAYHTHDASIMSELREIEASLSLAKIKEKEFQFARESIKTALESKSVEDLESSVVKYEKELLTETIADIYIAQGLHEKACTVLEKVLVSDPGNDAVRKKLAQSRLYLVNKSAGFLRGE